jgi:ABC-type glycerol-3-phosphate transport system substrate-binding protein
MRKISIVAFGAAVALTLAGCAAAEPAGSGDETDGAEIRVWLVGADTPQEARDYLKETFEEENPGSTLVIEEQAWGGLVDKLTTALSGSDSPDVVEVGNTQAAAFTTAGAFLDLSDQYDALGGDDLLPGFVEAGSVGETFFAAPYSRSTSRTGRRSPRRSPASRASTSRARTGTTRFPTSGRTAATSPRSTATSGFLPSRATTRSRASRWCRRS